MLSCLFLAALWSPAGKGLTSWLGSLVCYIFVTFPYVSWSTSKLRVRLVLLNMFKPPSDFFTIFPRWCFFFVSCLSLFCCIVCSLQPCDHLLGRADPLALLSVMLSCVFDTFPYGVPGHVWYLIVSILNLCILLYFDKSRGVRFLTMWCVRPAKAQTSLHIHAVWSEPLLVAYIFYEC